MESNRNGKSSCIRVAAQCLFLAVVFLMTSECHAQNQQGFWGRSTRVRNGNRLFFQNQQPRHHQHYHLETTQGVQQNPSPLPSTFKYDRPEWRDAYSNSRYPKFIGGFHSSHFSNIGLPSGDIGFRGNGIYWTPW